MAESATTQTQSGPISLSIRPWPRHDRDANSLENVLPRIHQQYKHFRHVTEAKLEQEIEDEDKGTVRQDDESSEADSEQEETRGTIEDVVARKSKLWGLIK